jgi:hypothetical protein
MPRPPIVWYTDANTVPNPKDGTEDRLSRIADLMKEFQRPNSKMDLEEFEKQYQIILKS